MLSLTLGPFALSIHQLTLLGALALAMALAWYLQRGVPGKRSAESSVFWLFVIGVLAARAGFVVSYWPQFRNDLLQIIDLRDGGALVWVGIIVALAGAGALGFRHPALRRPLPLSMAAGLVLWGLASIGISSLERQQRLPPLELHTASGTVTRLQDPQGRPMLVNLWATWCPPCRREMPVLKQGMQDYPGVAFMLVNQGENVADVATFLGTVGIDVHQVLFDPQGQLANETGSMALPTTLFYSADGRLLASHLGELSGASLAQALKVFERPVSVP